MERKDKLKKLNELKRSIIAMSLATTVVLGVSGCSNEDEPYYSEELSIEDYFESHDEDNCYAVSYIDNTKFDGKTFEEWNNVYKEARSNSIYDGDTIFTMSTGNVESDLSVVGMLSAKVMEKAVINAIKNAESLHGVKSYNDIK